MARIKNIFTQDDWNEVFAHANSIYTYDMFLNVVKYYPYFCNESNDCNHYNSCHEEDKYEAACKKELAGLFANWT